MPTTFALTWAPYIAVVASPSSAAMQHGCVVSPGRAPMVARLRLVQWVTNPSNRSEVPMNALTLLEDVHRKMRRLLDELETTTERGVKTREELFATIKGELTVHEIIEEEIFYPALKQHPKAEDIVLEGYEEHHVVDLVMGELEDLPVDDESWGAKAKVMKENVEHHMEEEEGDMFTKARSVFDRAELEELGERMAARKTEAQQQLHVPAGRS
jgi:hypothetical protein